MIRRRGCADSERAVAVIRRAAGWCLQYPDEGAFGALPVVRAAVDALPEQPARAELSRLLEHLAATSPAEVAQHYVRTFDTSPRRCLYLTWYADGDTRRRGASLVRIKRLYRAHGLTLLPGELPDFLPVVLEFAGNEGAAGTALLTEYRPGLVLLAANLEKFGTPYASAVRAVLETLPRGDASLPVVPPAEQVGLDPFPVARPGAHR
ncbi:nitrate reductase molybdenum cofactor assembly chaperone [Amycolatopsis anabasis]|uniref:nitrate reductase molybdenum cofactor assembly chaperone n=1 Tax=Amycolatopsis anabasis TaxID=1840409 RepID=UPI00131CA296|nr:nitrate reductase molybdenum cofactor assembly chaperone [Amycolatopsis anabasis]